MEQQIRRLGAGPVHYRRWGEGERALVLLHGLASNGTRWSELVRTSGLAQHWTVLVPDLRGYGLSLCREILRCEDWLDDLEAMLDQEGFTDCVVGGHCLGANLAARFALRAPERVRGLILVEPLVVPAMTGPLAWLARLRGLLEPLARGVLAANRLGLRRRRLPVLDLEEIDRGTRRKLAVGTDPGVFARRYGSPLRDLHHVPLSIYLQGLAQTLRPMPPWNEVGSPSLVILSFGSRFGELGRLRRILGVLPDHVIIVLESEHWIHAEQPTALRVHIETWLGMREAGRPVAPTAGPMAEETP
ncbi:MAG: alpha/beta hydrolase [Thioalkalivibrio sp.]|nr:MAG: alpha/beta hydrolase [Thioalkalivibrio sp.]